jgi:hypothetical protein
MGGKASAHAGDLLPATGQTTNVSHLFATVDVLLVRRLIPNRLYKTVIKQFSARKPWFSWR